MGSKKKKGTQVTVDSSTNAVQPQKPDMSKYARAESNKSKIDYSQLKLVRPETKKSTENLDAESSQKKLKASSSKRENALTKAKIKNTKEKKAKSKGKLKGEPVKAKPGKKETLSKPGSNDKMPVAATGSTAEERYSNALGSEDHYSSAVEKFYLKYPDAVRPKKSASAGRKSVQNKKRKSTSSDAGNRLSKRSMAEIAVKNKRTSSVKEHARSVRNAKARGVISTDTSNRSYYKRRKKRSGALNVLMVTVTLVFLVAVSVTVFFNVKQIRVEGESPYSEAQIKNMCTFKKGSNILFIDANDMEKRIVRELPYIAECKVERRLPSTVVISVKKAEILGVVQSNSGQWSVISTDGKILETATNQQSINADQVNGTLTYAPDYNSAADLAAARGLPVLVGLDFKKQVTDGFITGEPMEHIHQFVMIKDAFARVKMKLTSITYGERGYEGEFNNRIAIIFGKTIDQKTVSHRMDEVHCLIFEKKNIDETDKGEIRFYKNKVYFRHAYEMSTEELERIQEERRESNRKKLGKMAEIFLSTGIDWLSGKLKTE